MAHAGPQPLASVPGALDLEARYRLSRHVQLRPSGQGFVAESLITGRERLLPNATSIRLLLSLSVPSRPGELVAGMDAKKSSVLLQFFAECLEDGLITRIDDDGAAAEDALRSLDHWEPHDLAFHLRSRRGRTTHPVGATWHLAATVPPEPARRPKRPEPLEHVPLTVPDLARLKEADWPLTRALESRRSRYSTNPVPIDALSALLFRACRVTARGKNEQNDEMVIKVYPSGGSLHSLEVYVVANRCIGLDSGGYRYDGFNHRLERIRPPNDDLTTLLAEAQVGTGGTLKEPPSVLLIFASRFRRVTRKYQSLAYHVILQEVGCLYQTIYLVAETLGLAISGIGAGDSERFSRAFNTDFFAESSVGEMIVGGGTGT